MKSSEFSYSLAETIKWYIIKTVTTGLRKAIFSGMLITRFIKSPAKTWYQVNISPLVHQSSGVSNCKLQNGFHLRRLPRAFISQNVFDSVRYFQVFNGHIHLRNTGLNKNSNNFFYSTGHLRVFKFVIQHVIFPNICNLSLEYLLASTILVQKNLHPVPRRET